MSADAISGIFGGKHHGETIKVDENKQPKLSLEKALEKNSTFVAAANSMQGAARME